MLFERGLNARCMGTVAPPRYPVSSRRWPLRFTRYDQRPDCQVTRLFNGSLLQKGGSHIGEQGRLPSES